MSRMVSPDDLQDAARTTYLEGREPQTRRDWQLCVNFWAVNIHSGLEESACLLLGKIFKCPLNEDEIREIVSFQVKQKEQKEKVAHE